ncbi:hypothetical protein [Desulfobacter postgatei]|uniref:hypothetical protein n=1 Tax=Desulfobacter postgatei TaxID=2293 RepID=UPI00259B66F9|nr:hypothetical protein [uncultured Desulfobacter sp.]
MNAFFLVDGNGNVLDRNFSSKMEPGADKKVSKAIAACGSIYLSISPKQFRYAAFLRRNNTQVFIFPFGRHLLGVVTEVGTQNPDTDRIAKEIFAILSKEQPWADLTYQPPSIAHNKG